MKLPEDADLAAQLRVAFAPEVARVALEVAHRKELQRWWGAVAKRLAEVELGAMDAVLALHCMVRMDCCNRRLLTKVVDQIEGRYFSMELGLDTRHHAAELFPHSGSFRSLVDGLPLSHKVKIIIMDNVAREDGLTREKRLPPEPEPRKQWRTVDPVEMEAWEREQFEKGRLRVKRMRYVEAKVTRMRPGNKLGATLALQLLQVLPGAPPAALAEMAQICVFHPKVRPLHGDLLDDFQEELCKRVTALDTHQVRPHVLAFTSAMRTFPGPEACRAWRRKLVPAVLQVLSHTRSPLGLQVFDLQGRFHSRLRGVPHTPAGEASSSSGAGIEASEPSSPGGTDVEAPLEASEPSSPGGTDVEAPLEALRRRAERAAGLFVSVVTARQVEVDPQLFDALAAPVKAALRQHLDAAPADDAGDGAAAAAPTTSSLPAGHLLPLETMADVLDACVSCGVDDVDAELPRLLLQLFERQFGLDIREGRLALSAYAMPDLSTVAHAASVLMITAGGAEEPLSLVWAAAEPRLRATQPHLVLMLLNALVRGASEELLSSTGLAAAVDEHLVQRLDLDPSRLGRLGL